LWLAGGDWTYRMPSIVPVDFILFLVCGEARMAH